MNFKFFATLAPGLTALILLAAPAAHAATNAIFGRDNSKATVLMLAMSQNPDSIAFFEALSQPAQDEQGRSVKRFQFTDQAGTKSFTVVCAFSKLVGTTGSCTVVFYPAVGVYISQSEGKIQYNLKGEEAAALASYFKLPAVSGEAFRSTDNHFVIGVNREDENGVVTSLSIAYQQ